MTRKQFTLLFIRQDAHVRRFGLSTGGFALLLGVVVAIVAASVSGSYMAYVYWDRYRDLQQEHQGVRQRLMLTEQRLTRVENLEAFMRSFEPERLEAMLDKPSENGSLLLSLQGLEERSAPPADVSIDKVKLRRTGPGRLALNVEVASLTGKKVDGVVEVSLLMVGGGKVDLEGGIIDGKNAFSTKAGQMLKLSFPGPDQPENEIVSLVITCKDPEGAVLTQKAYPIRSILQ